MSLIPYLQHKYKPQDVASFPTFDFYLGSKLNHSDDCKYLTFLRQSTDPESDFDPIEFTYKIRSDGVSLAPFDAKDHQGRPLQEDMRTRELVEKYLDYLAETHDYESSLNIYIENALFQHFQSWDTEWFEHGFFTIEPHAPQDNKQRLLIRLTGQIEQDTAHENGTIFRIHDQFYGYLGCEYQKPTSDTGQYLLRRKQASYDYKRATSALWHEVIEPLMTVYPTLLDHKVVTPDWTFTEWKHFAQQIKQADLASIACLLPLQDAAKAEWFEELQSYLSIPTAQTEIPLHMH